MHDQSAVKIIDCLVKKWTLDDMDQSRTRYDK